MKRSLFLLLITCLLTALFCCFHTADAETYGDLTYQVSNGKVTITDCATSATSVTIPETIDGYPVTSISSYAFYDCDSLTSIVIPDSVTSIGNYAFAYCDSLTSIVIPDSVTSIGSLAFAWCSRLTSVVIGDSVTSIGSSAFYYCTSLTSIVIPNSVTSIGEWAFEGCTSLTSIVIPDSVTSIGGYAFWNCTSLTSIVIPDSVTSIGEWAFRNCAILTSVDIPDSVTSIGKYAFYDCSSLRTVNYYGGSSNWNRISIGSNNTCLTSATIIYKMYVKITDVDTGECVKFDHTNGQPIPEIYYKKDQLEAKLYTDRECTLEFDVTSPITANTGLYAVFGSVTYYHTFKDDAGNVLLSKKVPYGAAITPPTAPKKLPTTQYTYTFAGWDNYTPGMTQPNVDIVFTAKYTASVNRYTYTFTDYDGTVLKSKTVDYGTVIAPPADPAKPADVQYTYIFSGWSGFTSGMMHNGGELVFVAQYDSVINKYTHKFVDFDGSVIKTATVDYGSVIVLPENPQKSPTVKFSYPFIGWDGYTEGMTQPGRELVFTAQYGSVINKYTHKFVDFDGRVIKTATVDYESEIVPPADPQRQATPEFSYEFAGWDGFVPGTVQLGYVQIFTAKYNSVKNKYTYRFLDDDGTVLEQVTAEYGTSITPPATPADKDPYTFDYWQGYSNGMVVTGDTTITAVYKFKTYTVTVGTTGESFNAVYGTELVLPAATPTPDFDFAGYFTAENGGGVQVTDGSGKTLMPYGFPHDITVYPHFVHSFLDGIKFIGDTFAIIGQQGITQKALFATQHDAQYLFCTLKFPDTLTLTEITGEDFAEIAQESGRTENGFTYVTLTCVYSYNADTIPTNVTVNPFSLTFDVSTLARADDILSIEFLGDVSLVGESDHVLSDAMAAAITVLPKKAEIVEISGESSIDAPSRYTACVFPDYTTDKSVTWSVDDETIATISQDGVLTPVLSGMVTITATASDGSGVYGTKSVYVVAYATLDSLTSDIGVWDTPFDPYDYEYNITVDYTASAINLTPSFMGGVLRPNGDGVWINGKAKSFDIVNGHAVITLHRQNVDGLINSVYTIYVSVDRLKGDVNGDGTVNRLDLLRLAKHFAGYEVEFAAWSADVNGDDDVTNADLLRLAKYLSGWDVTLG